VSRNYVDSTGSEATKLSDRKPRRCLTLCVVRVRVGAPGPSRIGVDRAVTIMVDLTRDQAGCLHALLLDAVVGRSGSVYKSWLKGQPEGFVDVWSRLRSTHFGDM
jgi:hypothetical protein